jgi:hypothetical protein
MSTRPADCRSPRRCRLLLAAVVCCCAWPGVGRAAADPHHLGHPGYLVLVGAAMADSTTEFLWQEGPGPDQRSLVWPAGALTVPVDLTAESFGPTDLAVPCGAQLAGASHGGRLVFEPGIYEVVSPLLLTDGTVTLYAAAGELEILGERILYRPPMKQGRDPRASFILLAGLVLLTLVLLRRARRGLGGGRGR